MLLLNLKIPLIKLMQNTTSIVITISIGYQDPDNLTVPANIYLTPR